MFVTPATSHRNEKSDPRLSSLARYGIAAATLIIPVISNLSLKSYRSLAPLNNFLSLVAICLAAWWGGYLPGILAVLGVIFVTTLTRSGKVLPSYFGPTPLAIAFVSSILTSWLSATKGRVESVLRSANESLEERVRERTAELEKARNWLQTTLSSIGDAVIATDEHERIAFLNGVAQDLTGWPESEALGRPLVEIFQADEGGNQPAEEQASPGLPDKAQRKTLISRTGREIPIEGRGSPIRDSNDALLGRVLTFHDISERIRTERMAEQARSALERTNEELQQFAYAASHDFQEPLRNMTIYAQLLRRRYSGKLDTQADHITAVIVNGAKRMESLLRDLLGYTRTFQASLEDIGPVDATKALKNALGNLRTSIEESAAKISSNGMPMVAMREGHLEQLFQNLVGNAIKYRAKMPPEIHVSALESGTEWIFSVKDNGIGIAPEYHEKIFGLFKRLHSPAEYPGTGIGLAICKKVVEYYGGRIWVESQQNCGADFRFTVPKVREGQDGTRPAPRQ